ncbi:MAG: hypothetical protein IPK26_19945 [Planctomycetes bacterium]|nr:hypothetical protein [Planctomycetota bacterium]
MHTTTTAALFGLAFSLTAQQTLIVDRGGTGNYTDLAPALAAAAPGDTVLLRGGGTWPGNYTLNVAIALLAEAPRPRITALRVVGANTRVLTLSGIDFDTLELLATSHTAAEQVHVGNLSVVSFGFAGSITTAWNGCALGSATTGGAVFGQESVILTNCTLRGRDALCDPTTNMLLPATAALVVGRFGFATIADSVLIGGDGNTLPCGVAAPAPAMIVDLGTAQVSRSTLQGGTDGVQRAAAISLLRLSPPPPMVVLDPSVQTIGAVPATWVGVQPVPSTAGAGATPGNAMSCTLQSQPGQPAVLLGALQVRAPAFLPEGRAWLTQSLAVVLAIGTTDAGGQLPATIQVPGTAQRGLAVTVQGVVLAAGALRTTAPTVLLVQ